MNKLLNDQINKFIKDPSQLSSDVKTLLMDIDSMYTKLFININNLKTSLQQNPVNIASLAQEETQTSLLEQEVINGLKSAIAVIEPNSKILTEDTCSSDETTYLIDSLLKIINSHKEIEDKLRERKQELEELNVLLKNEKKELASQRAKDQAILFAIGDGLIVLDENQNIILTNQSFHTLLGWSRQEVFTQKVSKIIKKENIHGLEEKNLENLYIEVIQKRKTYISPADSSFYYFKKDGTKFPVSISITPIILDNQIIGTVEIFKDITKEKEIEKAKNEFVSLASHQLRTPLSSVNWYTEMLLDDDLEGDKNEYKNYLKEIEKAITRMQDMINALLNISRLELGTLAIEPEPVNAIILLKKIIDELKPTIISKQQLVNGKFDERIPEVITDPKLLSMVFQNLLSNAVKYTPEKGNISIQLKLDEQRDEILASIQDNGFGIPQKDQKKIFSKMFRASNILKHDTDGNGLGLYIVKLILEAIGGKVWFESIEGKGTTFFFTIPTKSIKTKKEGKKLI